MLKPLGKQLALLSEYLSDTESCACYAQLSVSLFVTWDVICITSQGTTSAVSYIFIRLRNSCVVKVHFHQAKGFEQDSKGLCSKHPIVASAIR